jgi:lysophospholipase L1-like esterase
MTARGRLLSGLVTMVIALAGFVTVGALPAAANSDNVQYVALGDSYAAGVGAGSYDGSRCVRSSNGYPELLDSERRIVLQVNATCAGATITYVADNLPSELNRDTRLVTLTVGGNDLGFAGLAGPCLAGTLEPEDCLAAIDNAVAVDRLSDLGRALTGLYAQVADAAPEARIVVTGYPFLFEPPAAGDPSPSAEIINRLREATALLNDTIEEAVAATREADVKIVYVDVTAAFVGHGIGTRDPQDLFINRPGPTPSVEDFHPNVAGYVAYADAIATKLPNGWLDKNKQLV